MSKGAVHNALSRGVLPSALSRAVGDMEGSSGLERYGETLTPILDLWASPEFAFLRREYLMAWSQIVGAVAAEFSAVGILNPAGSGWITILEEVTIQTAAQDFFTGNLASESTIKGTLLLGGGGGRARDLRAGAFPGQARIWYGTDPGFVGSPIEWTSTPAVNSVCQLVTSLPLIISPGNGFVIESFTVNTAATFNLKWRERKAFPGELD